MRNHSRYIVGGAAVGAVVGALAGWAVSRKAGAQSADDGVVARQAPIESRQLMRLGSLIVSLIRQIVDLG